MEKSIHRLFNYLKYKDYPHTRFEKEIGLSNGYLMTQLKRKAFLGEGVLLKVIDNCLDLNPIWLLTGEGEMIKNKIYNNPEKAATPEDTLKKERRKEVIRKIVENNELLLKLIEE